MVDRAVLRIIAGRGALPLPDECCGRCRFWLAIDELPVATLGGCRRRSPTMQWRYSVTNGPRSRQYDANWPLTDAEDWCGEFGAREGAATLPAAPPVAEEDEPWK